MSKTVDQRVVQMEFNNANFERNVSTTMSTLDKLKAKLNFKGSVQGMDELEKATSKLDFHPITDGVEKVQASFSMLDVIVGRVLTNMVDSAYAAGKSLVKSLTVDQITAAWDKYSSKTSSVAMIMAATAKDFDDVGDQMEFVNSRLEQLNWYTDETSAKYLDMVNNIGKFTSNSVDLDTAVTAMQGIANWGYLSGANLNESARAMYNLAQAISVGSVKLIDWKSIENANMATAEFKQTVIDTAVSLGTLRKAGKGTYKTLKGNEVSAKNFNAALSDAWFTSEVLLKSLDKYGEFTNRLYELSSSTGLTATELLNVLDKYRSNTLSLKDLARDTGISVEDLKGRLDSLTSAEMALGEKAFRAAQEAKTFQEAIDAVKDAVSTQWMTTFEKIFGDYEQAKKLWSEFSMDLWEIFAGGGEARNNLLTEVLGDRTSLMEDAVKWERIYKYITDKAGISYSDLKKAVIETARDSGIAIDEMLEKYGSFGKTLDRGWFSAKILYKAFDNLAEKGPYAARGIESTTDAVKELKDLVNRVINGEFGVGEDRVKRLTEAGYDYNKIQGLVNKTVWNQAIAWDELSDAELKNIGYTEEQIKAIRDLQKEFYTEGELFSEMWDYKPRMSGRELLIDSFRNALHGLMEMIDLVKGAWEDIFPKATADKIYDALVRVHDFTKVFRIFYEEVQEHTGEFDETGQEIIKTVKKLTPAGERLTSALKGVFAVLDIIKDIAKGAFGAALTFVRTLFGGVAEGASKTAGSVGDAIVRFRDWLRENKVITTAFERLGNTLAKAANKIRDWIKQFKELEWVQNAVQNVKDWFQGLNEEGNKLDASGISAFFDRIGTWFTNAKENIKSVIEYVKNLEGVKTTIEKVSNVFKKAWGIISGAAVGLWEGLKTTWGNIKDTFDLIGSDIQSGTVGTFNTITDKLSTSFEKVKETFTKVFSWISERLEGVSIASIIGAFFGYEAIKIFGSLIGVVVNIGKAILNFSASLKSLSEGLKNLGKAKLQEAKAEKWKAIAQFVMALTALVGALVVAGTTMDASQLRNVASFFTAIGVVMLILMAVASFIASGSNNILDAVGDILPILGMILAIRVIANALVKLAGVKFGDGIKAIALLGACMALLLGLTVLMSKLSAGITASGYKSAGSMMLKFALSVIMIALALKIMADIKPEKMAVAIVALISIFTMLGVLLVITSLANKQADTAAKTVLAIGACVLLMAIALKTLSKIKPEKLIFAVAALTTVMAMMVFLLLSTKAAGDKAAQAGLAALGIAAAILIIAIAVRMLGKLKDNEIAKSIFALNKVLILILALVGAALVLNVASLVPGKSDSTVKNLLALAGSVLLLAIAIKILASVDPKRLAPAVLATVVLIAAVTIMAKKAGGITGKAVGNILALGGVVMALALVVALLSSIKDPKRLIISTLALSALMLAFAVVVKVASKVSKDAKIAPLLVMAAVVIVLGGILLLLSQLGNPESLIPSAAALSLLLVAFAGALYIISEASTKMNFKKLGSVMFQLEAVVLGLATILVLMSRFGDAEALIPAAEALSLLLLAFSASLLIISQIKELDPKGLEKVLIDMLAVSAVLAILLIAMSESKNPEALIPAAAALSLLLLAFSASLLIISQAKAMDPKSLAIILLEMVVVAGLLAALLIAMTEMADPNEVIPMAIALSALLIAFGAAMVLISVAGLIAAPAAAGLSAIMIFVAGFAGLVLLLGELAKNPDVVSLVQGGIELLILLGEGIGRFVGAIVGGLIDQVVSYLPSIGTNISQFMTNLQGFVDGVKQIDDGVLDATLRLAKVILTLTGAALLEQLVGFFGGEVDFAKFGTQLAALGPGIKLFATFTKGIDEESIKGGAAAAEMLAEMASKLPKSGGILQKVVGETDWTGFIKNIPLLATSLKDFSTNLGDDFNASDVEAAANSAKALAEMENNLPKEGGLLQRFLGEGNMDKFLANLPTLGTTLQSFSTNLGTDFSSKNVEAAANAASALAEMEGKLPKEGGFLQSILGTGDMDTFMSNLPVLGKSLNDFSLAIPDVDAKTIESAANAALTLTELSKNMPEEGGWLKSIFGGNKESLGTFGENLQAFGLGVAMFASAATGINADIIDRAKYSSEAIITLVDKLEGKLSSESGGFLHYISGDGVGHLGANLSTFGSGIVQFRDSVRGLNKSVVDGATYAANTLAELSNVPESALSGWIMGGSFSVSEIAGNLSTFGKYFKEFADFMTSSSPATVVVYSTSAAAVLKLLYDSVKSYSDADILYLFGLNLNNFGDNFNAYYGYIKNMSSAKLNDITVELEKLITVVQSMRGIDPNACDGVSTALSELGRTGIDGFIKSIDGSVEDVQNTISELLSKMTTVVVNEKPRTKASFENNMNDIMKDTVVKIRSFYNAFYEAGVYLAKGLAKGITDNKHVVANAGGAVGRAGADSARSALKEHSPSKVMAEVGKFFSLGFAEGITKYGSAVESASEEVSVSAIDGINNSIAAISEMVENGVDGDPVITPILDLTEIQNGVTRMSGMLTGNSYSIAGNVSKAVTGTLNSKATLEDVVSGLQQQVQTLSDERVTNNTFYITGDNPRDIADQVANILQLRVERAERAWA